MQVLLGGSDAAVTEAVLDHLKVGAAGEPELKLYGLAEVTGDLLRNACRQAWWIGQPHTAADVFLLDVTQATLIEWDLERGQMTSTHWSPGRGLRQQARAYP